MADAFLHDIQEGDTRRTTLLGIHASGLAATYYELKYPEPYRSVQVVNGHRIVVMAMDADNMVEELNKYVRTPLRTERDEYE